MFTSRDRWQGRYGTNRAERAERLNEAVPFGGDTPDSDPPPGTEPPLQWRGNPGGRWKPRPFANAYVIYTAGSDRVRVRSQRWRECNVAHQAIYTVSLNAACNNLAIATDGEGRMAWQCTCPDFAQNGSNNCKHMRTGVEQLPLRAVQQRRRTVWVDRNFNPLPDGVVVI
jgi:hypothetical protein